VAKLQVVGQKLYAQVINHVCCTWACKISAI